MQSAPRYHHQVDALGFGANEYLYVSDRLLGDIYEQVTASRRKTGASVGIKLGFLTVNSVPRNLGINRYRIAEEVTELLSPITGSLAYPSTFIRFRTLASWFDLYVREQKYRVAWIVAEQSGNEGHFLVALCGGIDNYIGYSPVPTSKLEGWKPSAVKGLIDIIASCSKQPRKFKDAHPGGEEEIRNIVFEAAHISMGLQDHDHSQFIGTGMVEILARVYFALGSQAEPIRLRRLMRGGVASYDGIFVGAPLWVRVRRDLNAIQSHNGGMMVVDVPL